MQPQMLWFALAGFVLGFATSTLWEWLYYRGQRLRLREPLHYVPVAPASVAEISAFEAEALPSAPSALDERTTEYRSPGVFLESEQRPVLRYPPNSEPISTLAPEAWSAAWEEEPAYAAQPHTAASTPLVDAPLSSTPSTAEEPESIGEDPDFSAEGLTVAALIAPAAITRTESSQASTFVPAEVAPAPARADASSVAPVPPAPLPLPVVVGQRNATVPPLGAAAPSPAPLTLTERTASAAPVGPVRRVVEHPDDLGKIRGIGEIYKQRLFAAGIYTWQQVVDSEVEVLRRITRAKPNADIGDWQSQAQALVKQFNRGGATYSGPAPEDLTLIDGIGPTAMEALYQAGITTFARLATTTPVELAAILPAPTIGMEFHFTDWIAQAAQRAQRPAPQAG